MRNTKLLLALALVTTSALAQNTADQPGTASPQEQQGNAMEGSKSMKEMHEGASMKATMHEMHGQQAETIKSAQADLAAMRAHLVKMREQTVRTSDQARKEEQQLNNDMWQMLIDHMDAHMTKMSRMMHSPRDGTPGNAWGKAHPEHYEQ